MEYGNPNPMEAICRYLRELGYGEANQLPPEHVAWLLQQPRLIEIVSEQLMRRNLLPEDGEPAREEVSLSAPETNPEQEPFDEKLFALDDVTDVENDPTEAEDLFADANESAPETDQFAMDDLLLAEEEPPAADATELIPAEETDGPATDDLLLVEEDLASVAETEPSSLDDDGADDLLLMGEEPAPVAETEPSADDDGVDDLLGFDLNAEDQPLAAASEEPAQSDSAEAADPTPLSRTEPPFSRWVYFGVGLLGGLLLAGGAAAVLCAL
jgi:hypothetical protein